MVRVMATGRSDYPNQISNALCFPGMFRGALDVRAREINEEMKLAAAHAIASGVPTSDLNEGFIVPSTLTWALCAKLPGKSPAPPTKQVWPDVAKSAWAPSHWRRGVNSIQLHNKKESAEISGLLPTDG